MRVVLNDDKQGGLGIPYGFEDERRFWNLRRFPDLIDRVPELAEDPGLLSFVRSVNLPESRFATLGCQGWTKSLDWKDSWIDRLCGAYVDVSGDRMELISRENYVVVQQALAERGQEMRHEDESSDLTQIEVEPQRVSFNDLRVSGWVGTFWVLGYGNTDDMARHYRDRGLEELAALLERDSRSITECHGLKGTRIFERLTDNGSGEEVALEM